MTATHRHLQPWFRRIIANVRPCGSACVTAQPAARGGAPFTANAIWTTDSVTVEGKTATGRPRPSRGICPHCGSASFGVSDGTDEIVIQLGVFDAAPTDLAPTYELWVTRRERWLPMIPGAKQYDGNRA
jgi:hypothetical protein